MDKTIKTNQSDSTSKDKYPKDKTSKTAHSMKDLQLIIKRQNKNKYVDEALQIMKTTFFKYFFGVVALFSLLCLCIFSYKTIFILIFGMFATLVAEVVILYKVLNLNIVSSGPNGGAEITDKPIQEKDYSPIPLEKTFDKVDKKIATKEKYMSDVKRNLFPEIPENDEFENVLEEADEDQGNDLKINYKSLIFFIDENFDFLGDIYCFLSGDFLISDL